jgi:hypothetical protein
VDVPAEAYLATHYEDIRAKVETRRVYYNDGRVEAFDGKEWWSICQLAAAQVIVVKQAIRDSGIMHAADQGTGNIKDTAALTYAWHIGSNKGSVTNFAYPAKKHPAMVALDRVIDPLVEAAKTPEE